MTQFRNDLLSRREVLVAAGGVGSVSLGALLAACSGDTARTSS
jgi:hypothetical protein